MAFNPFVVGPGISSAICIVLGLYVLHRNPHSPPHRAQFLFSLTLCGWLFCFTMMYATNDPEKALLWARAGFFSIALVSPSNFYITWSFLENPGNNYFLWLISIVTALLCALSPTHYIYTHVKRFYWGFYPQAGKLYPLFILQYALVWAYGLRLLHKRMQALKQARDFVTYNQIRYCFLGFLGGSLGVVDFIGKYGIPVYPFAYVVAVFWTAIVAFAVLRNRLLADISFVIRRALIVSAIAVVLALLIGGGYWAIFWLSQYFPILNRTLLTALGCIVLGFSVQPLFRFITAHIDRLFFSEYYNREKKLKLLGHEILQAKNAEEFNRIILTGIVSCFTSVRASFFLLDETAKAYVLQSAVGWGTKWGEDAITRLEVGEPLIQYLGQSERAIVTMADIMRASNVSVDQKRLALSMLKLEATVAVPVMSDDGLRGLLILGDKESGLPYETEDYDSLRTLAGHMSLVMENLDLIDKWSKEQRTSSKLGEVLHRYMSSSVADEILNRLQDHKAWKGDRRHVAVLMSDLRNFTGISELRTPEEVAQSLNDYFNPLVEIILSAGGSVDKFIGDAILVVFGAPIAMADAEARAVHCALDMQATIHELNKKRGAAGLFQFDMGIGITAGPVVAGNIGSNQRMDYTVIGPPVNLASRLQGLAQAGQILVTSDVAAKVKSDIPMKNLGPMPLKGHKNLVEVFQVVNDSTPLDARITPIPPTP